jgi:hypothetical protein
MYGGTTPEKKPDSPTILGEPRKSDADVFYNSAETAGRAFEQLVTVRGDELAGVGMTAEQRQAIVATGNQIHEKSGLAYGTITAILDAGLSVDISEHQGQPFEESTRRQKADATRAQLVGQYGRDRAECMIAETERWLSEPAQSALRTQLDKRDIGARSEVFLPILEHVRRIKGLL